ncbi:Hypothetical_protein [Hexamita inflata]|uniref:Hypothetical_protein n=1 Tax=Hexamita inflata TaxID=28002 RepID=A0AA86Q715_9EUKA|nr:Hypothetical protein HINF_LOCUS38247 [Hexamita inflata]
MQYIRSCQVHKQLKLISSAIGVDPMSKIALAELNSYSQFTFDTESIFSAVSILHLYPQIALQFKDYQWLYDNLSDLSLYDDGKRASQAYLQLIQTQQMFFQPISYITLINFERHCQIDDPALLAECVSLLDLNDLVLFLSNNGLKIATQTIFSMLISLQNNENSQKLMFNEDIAPRFLYAIQNILTSSKDKIQFKNELLQFLKLCAQCQWLSELVRIRLEHVYKCLNEINEDLLLFMIQRGKYQYLADICRDNSTFMTFLFENCSENQFLEIYNYQIENQYK